MKHTKQAGHRALEGQMHLSQTTNKVQLQIMVCTMSGLKGLSLH